MTNAATGRLRRWVSYVACVWALLFAAPHVWWALGIPAGFPGGEASYQVFMSSRWLFLYNLTVIALSGVAVFLAGGILLGGVAWLARSPVPWVEAEPRER
jgi:hypothetical protein